MIYRPSSMKMRKKEKKVRRLPHIGGVNMKKKRLIIIMWRK